MNNNPFIISTYKSPAYFCNRKKETKQLKDALENGRNIVLLSLRRMGKTGLIKHLFYKLESDKNVHTFYLDIMNTNSTEDFVNKLADSVLGTFNSRSKQLFDQVLQFFSKFNPLITFDAITGVPSIELKPHSEQQAKNSLAKILDYLESQNKRIYIAIDEFQQITSYKDSDFEAFLRSHIQHLKNVNFIFSGSQQHLLTSMFNSYSRPFYQSSDFLKLERIDQSSYTDFIIKKYKETNKIISKEIVIELLNWADTYTFYVQNLFNKLWYVSGKQITKNDVEYTKSQIIGERNYIYLNLQNLLPKAQYYLLKAIAKNRGIDKPTSKYFVNKYNLGTPSTVSTALKILQTKEIIYKENNIYKIYDVFLAKWMEEYE
ncbi:MAG: ATP-binding protein [Bacteroidota bacterium]